MTRLKPDLSNLKKVREERDVTQGELAKAVGVSVNTIRSWEQGTTKNPSEENVRSLMSFFA
jgi:DNA-binding XRE family transcriptional regulator